MGQYENESKEPVYYPGPLRRESTELRVIAFIIALTAIILYVDIITPLGFSAWILYLIPLFLTLYVRWKYAPFAASAVFIGLITTSFFLSPPDIPVIFALSNRLFFSMALIVTSFFIWNYNRAIDQLRKHEKRYRDLAESSPDTIIVHRAGTIVYTNPAGLRMFGADKCNDILKKDLTDLVDPGERENFKETTRQVMEGARIPIHEVMMARLDGTRFRVVVLNEKILWDGLPAAEVILRDITDR
jgi:PAS domain S-box-containing protein